MESVAKTRIAVGMSGGVDSSVCAALLHEKGYSVVGVSMRIYDGPSPRGRSRAHGCYGPEEGEDLAAAASVCEQMGIPFHIVDLRKAYREHVLDYVIGEYRAGRTPNPCVRCNRLLKFGFLLEAVGRLGINWDFYATGHYARVCAQGSRFVLKRAEDRSKDQSYFLHRLTSRQLTHSLFPIGSYTKETVREMARDFGLPTMDRPESQDFITGGRYTDLFKERERPGEIVDKDGTTLGTHRGIEYYTVGQRKGLGIASPRPLYVTGIDGERNRLVVGEKRDLLSARVILSGLELPGAGPFIRPMRAEVKIRANHRPAAATLYPRDGGRAVIQFDEPQTAVTPGQSAVVYSGDTVLGGGIVERTARIPESERS